MFRGSAHLSPRPCSFTASAVLRERHLLISLRHIRDHRRRVFLEDATLAFQQPLDIYAVLLGEVGNLVVLELHDWPDLFVGKITRCGYVPDALPHRLFKLAPTRHRFAVGTTDRVRVQERDVVGDRAFDPVMLDGEIAKIPPAKFCAFPCNGGDIRCGREQPARDEGELSTTCKNSRLRQARDRAWNRARHTTSYWRARLDWQLEALDGWITKHDVESRPSAAWSSSG